MMNLVTYTTLFLIIYIAALIGLTLWSKLQGGKAGYVIGNRNIGTFTTICSMLAGQFNGGGVFFIITFGLLYGMGALWFGIGFLLGYILLSFFAKTVHTEAQKHGDITVPDILKRRLGYYTHHFGNFIVIGKALLFGTAQILIAGKVLAAVLNLPTDTGIWLTAAIIGFYVCLGGYLTVVRTDVLQWLILFGLIVGVAIAYPTPSLTETWTEFTAVPPIAIWGFMLFTFTLIISNTDAWQRTMSAKDHKVAKKSLLWSGALFMVFTYAGYAVVKHWAQIVGHEFNFFSLFQTEALSPIILATLGVYTLTAVMSTIDTQVYLFSSTLAKNVLNIDIDAKRTTFIRLSQVASIVLLAVIAGAATMAGPTLNFVMKAFSFAYILAPVVILAMLWSPTANKYKDMTCVIALLAGLGVYSYMFFNAQFTLMINNVIPAGITTAICLVGWLLSKVSRR